MASLIELTAREISAGVQRRDFSAAEVITAHLDRIAAIEPKVHAWRSVLGTRALERAQQVDSLVRSGSVLPLAGVPIAVKDILHIEGVPTTCGSRILEDYRPPYTATAVARLEQAGAICLGKTNLDEFAMGSSTENSGYGPTLNPWDTTRVPGGSSGGSAAAVAASMVPVALGTDTGGSIRQPAAFCGVVGLKPTYGRVSRYGVVAYASSLDQVGPIAHDIEDLALLTSQVCGRDSRDATSAALEVPDFCSQLRGDTSGLRIGVPWAFLGHGLDGGVLASFRAALAVLEGAGMRLLDIALPHLDAAIATYYLVATAEASSNLARYDGVRYGLRAGEAADLSAMYGETRDRGFGPEVKRRIILGTFVLSSGYYDAYYLAAQKVRTLIRRDFEMAFQACDVIALPTTPSAAFRLGEKTADPLKMYLSDIYVVATNPAGVPSLCVPCGFSNGMPVGMQLIGRHLSEDILLRIGHAYQSITDWHLMRPEVAG
jgi:aspartyl-tRNA(Asn)/glutamyl-tRNA(Gln) amidotransferase subunit A